MGDSSPGLVQVSATGAIQTGSPLIVYRNSSVAGYTRSLRIYSDGRVIAIGIDDTENGHIVEGLAEAEPTEVSAFAERLFRAVEGMPGYLHGGTIWHDRVDIRVHNKGHVAEAGWLSDLPKGQAPAQMVPIEEALDSIWDMVPKATIE